MILRGMMAGNPVEIILQRALVGLVGGTLIGLVLGWLATVITSENLPSADDAEPIPVAEEVAADSASSASGDASDVEVVST